MVVDPTTGRITERHPHALPVVVRDLGAVPGAGGGELLLMGNGRYAPWVDVRLVRGDPYAVRPTIRWRRSAHDAEPVRCGRLVVSRVVTQDGGDRMSAIDALTGAGRWEVRLGTYVVAPVCVGGRIWTATSDRLMELDAATGRILMRRPIPETTIVQLVGGDGLLLAVLDGLVAFDVRTGARRWSLPRSVIGEQDSDASSAGEYVLHAGPDRILTTSETGLLLVDPRSGRLIRPIADPYHGDVLTRSGIVRDLGRTLELLDPASGRPRWTLRVPPYADQPLLAVSHGRIYRNTITEVTAYS